MENKLPSIRVCLAVAVKTGLTASTTNVVSRGNNFSARSTNPALRVACSAEGGGVAVRIPALRVALALGIIRAGHAIVDNLSAGAAKTASRAVPETDKA